MGTVIKALFYFCLIIKGNNFRRANKAIKLFAHLLNFSGLSESHIGTWGLTLTRGGRGFPNFGEDSFGKGTYKT